LVSIDIHLAAHGTFRRHLSSDATLDGQHAAQAVGGLGIVSYCHRGMG
jgi:hypothetical protein